MKRQIGQSCSLPGLAQRQVSATPGNSFCRLAAVVLVLWAGGCAREQAEPQVQAHRITTVTTYEVLNLPGQPAPAEADTVILWLGPQAARRDTREGTFLVDPERHRLTFLDHTTRTWTSQTTAEIQRQIQDLAAAAPDTTSDDLQLDQLQSMLEVAVKVTDTGEEARIDGYHCRRWLVQQFLGDNLVSSELWLTLDIELDSGLLHQATRPALLAMPGGQAAAAELARLQGVTVLSTTLMRLQEYQARTETRLLAVEEVTVPAGFFAPPPGYLEIAGDTGAR